MSVGYNPKIAANGLVLYIDAANKRSYSGSGTTWYDLSGKNNNGTITNLPSFDSSGFFTFNGTSQRVQCGNDTSLQITVGSIGAWIAPDNSNNGYRGIITKQFAWGLFLYNNELISYDWGGGGERFTGIILGDNSWNHVAMTFTETTGSPSNNAKIYLNGLEILTTTATDGGQGVEVQIADGNSGQYFSGKISSASVHNRVLTPSEIQQNFNALRGRFGI